MLYNDEYLVKETKRGSYLYKTYIFKDGETKTMRYNLDSEWDVEWWGIHHDDNWNKEKEDK